MTDWRMYLVTSGNDRRTVEVAAAAARGGAGVVQVRHKQGDDRELLALVTAVAAAVERANPDTRVVVDDATDVAWAARRAGAAVHGVHLGQDDLPVEAARQILGPDALVGLTTGTLELVERAQQQAGVVDYLGAGPFRPTPTKDSGRAPLGVEGYRPLVQASRIPVLAIGDVTPADVEALAGTGIAGVCMVRHVMQAADPEALVRGVLAGYERGRLAAQT